MHCRMPYLAASTLYTYSNYFARWSLPRHETTGTMDEDDVDPALLGRKPYFEQQN